MFDTADRHETKRIGDKEDAALHEGFGFALLPKASALNSI